MQFRTTILDKQPETVAATPISDTSAWMRSMLPLSLLSGMQIINSQADVVMLGLFNTSEEVGVYRAATQGATLVVFFLSAINLAILCVGQLVNAAAGSVGMLLNMSGHERDTACGVAVATVTNVILNLILVPRLGMTGAAIATAVTLVIWNALLCRQVWVRMGIQSTAIRFRIAK